MSGVAAAVGGGAVLGAVMSSNASGKQSDAAAANLKLAEEKFNYQKGIEAPYQEAGVKALSGMQDARFQKDFSRDMFKTSPGYQFSLKQGQDALNAANAATGNQVSGAGMAALSKYNVGTADQEYEQAFNNYQNQQNNQFGRLSTLAAGGAGANAAMGNASSNFVKSASDARMAGANAQAAGQMGVANSITQGLTGLAGIYGGRGGGGGNGGTAETGELNDSESSALSGIMGMLGD